jgi:hypothetical protein
MLEKIKKIVFEKYWKLDDKWIFISAFWDNNQVLLSTWVLYSNKSMEDTIDTIYHWLVEKIQWIKTVIIDVVVETKEVFDISELNWIWLKEWWVALVTDKKSGVILPDVKWVLDFSQGIQLIKAKNGLEWNAKILIFRTDRFIVSL